MLKERYLQPQFDEVQVGENALQVYRDGYELYAAMLAAIDEAQESIYLEASIWRDDETGRAFKQHLSQKAAQGVEVYVMCGNLGKRKVSRAFGSFPSGVHILRTMPFRRPWHVLDPRRYAPDHRKLLVVDGLVGFVGGYNLGNPYQGYTGETRICVFEVQLLPILPLPSARTGTDSPLHGSRLRAATHANSTR